MENQQLFNVIVTVAGFLAGWVVNNITKNMTRIEDKIEEIPHIYVRREDYRRDIDEIKDICKQIFAKLDNKADK
jgi:hypothetical protein